MKNTIKLFVAGFIVAVVIAGSTLSCSEKKETANDATNGDTTTVITPDTTAQESAQDSTQDSTVAP